MATGATEFIDTTTAAAFVPEIWSREAIVARESKLFFAALVNRKFEEEVSFGDTVHVPGITNMTSRTKSLNTAITFETATETNTDITIATNEYAAIAIETSAKKQSMQDLIARYAPKMGYALNLAIDDVLAGLIDDFSNALGTFPLDLTYEDVLRAKQYLDDADAPTDDRYIAVSPAQESGFRKLDQFVHADYERLQQNTKIPAARGYIGTWMSMPVYMGTNVEGTNAAGHDNGMWQREALALIVQMKPPMYRQFDIDYLAWKYAMEQLYGSREMRDDHGVFMRGA